MSNQHLHEVWGRVWLGPPKRLVEPCDRRAAEEMLDLLSSDSQYSELEIRPNEEE